MTALFPYKSTFTHTHTHTPTHPSTPTPTPTHPHPSHTPTSIPHPPPSHTYLVDLVSPALLPLAPLGQNPGEFLRLSDTGGVVQIQHRNLGARMEDGPRAFDVVQTGEASTRM